MNVYFYKNFKKRTNSTKQPAVNSQDRIIDCQLKENCSIENPILRITTGSATAGWQDNLNYAYIPSWGRYYKVEDGVYAGGNIWEVHLVDDAPASNKSEILNTIAFIEYAGDVTASFIPDTRLTMSGNYSYGDRSYQGIELLDDRLYYYVSAVSANGSDRVYQLSRSNLNNFVTNLSALNGTILDKIAAQCGSAFGAISRVIAMPFIASTYMTVGLHTDNSIDCAGNTIGTGHIYYWEPTDTSNEGADPCVYLGSKSITVPWSNIPADYRRLRPYTEFRLFLPFYGDVDIDPALLCQQTSITVAYVISLRDGSITYRVNCNTSVIGPFTAKIGQEVAIGQSFDNNLGFFKGAVDVAAGAANAAMGNYLGAAQGMTNGLINMGVASMQRHVNVNGASTGLPMSKLGLNIELTRNYYPTPVDPSNMQGTLGCPYMRVETLSNHSGYYVKCRDASVDITHYAGEAETINNMLNSGIYLE